MYPEQNWTVEQVSARLPKNYWSDISKQREALDNFAHAHGITSPEQWNSVNVMDIKNSGAGGLLNYYPSFFDALQKSKQTYSQI